MLKRLINHTWAQVTFAWLIRTYVELVRRTIRWDVRNKAVYDRVISEDITTVTCAWHGRALMVVEALDPHLARLGTLASKSPAGNIGAQFAAGYGIKVVRGSSHNPLKPQKRKGGAAAFRTMIRLLRDKKSLVITPDGPRGPRMRCGYGPILLARQTGVPIIPLSWSVSRRTLLDKAWDHHIIPHFFCRGVIIFGDPIEVPRELTPEEMEAYRVKLENALNRLSEEADIAAGVDVMQPADPLPSERSELADDEAPA